MRRAGRQAAQKSEQAVFKKIKALRAAAAYDEDYGDRQAGSYATKQAGR
jgi:hypothetical protein